MPVDWNSADMLKWKNLTKQKQQEICDSSHIVNGRKCKLSDISNLKEIFGFPLSGVSEEETVQNFTDVTKIFANVEKSMKKHEDENILLSALFVLVKIGDGYVKLPVIKLKQAANIQQDNYTFFDSCGRVYKNWKDYLKNNTLPNREICYPKNGVYPPVNCVVEVEHDISPAGKTGTKVLRSLDFGGTVLGLGAAGVGFAALFFPWALPVVAGAVAVSVLTEVYATGRNIQTLVDRRQHQQSIGLRSSEARRCWLGIVGNLIGIASGGVTVAYAMRVGSRTVMSLAGQIAVKSVTTVSHVVNAVRVTSGMTDKIRKLMTRREFARRLANFYDCKNLPSQKEKSLEKMWGIVKDFMNVEVFHEKYRISGIPNDHFFQEVFNVFKGKKKYGFSLSFLDTANTLSQDDVDKFRSDLLKNMPGLSCNGNQSEGQNCMLEAELTEERNSIYMYECGGNMPGLSCNGNQSEEQNCKLESELAGNTDSICISECGDTAITKGNDGAD